ncbi:reverse transcriptase domain-containing protein [Tanacetum coccineum]|uniref:Reverse transcriptase domain-containing protein n=1 Tax=Tanacetum coccineum TaxID=301880 RepID=A0ABQ4YXF7_9ASTR
MAEEDEEKTTFHTNQGVFYYTKMPFGLKNVGATYQRLMDKAFEKHISRNLEVYVDDLVIKSHTEHEILKDVEETFCNLRRINMKLNPKKCTFDAEEGAFLGHVVSMKGIKACPEKTEASDFQWTPKAERAFQGIKQCIAKLPMVTAPRPREELIMYLYAAREAAHSIVVITDQPIKQILSRPENTRRKLKWKFELESFDITYMPRTSIRGQILADFIAERPDEEDPPMETPAEEVTPEPWTLFTDGSSCRYGSGAGLILTNPEGEEFTYTLRFEFDASNNEAEYEALIVGLRIAEQIGVKNLVAKVDSYLVANQFNRSYEAKEQSMIQYLEKSKAFTDNFKMFSIEQVPQSKNKKEEEGYYSMTSLIEYLVEGTLLADTKKAQAVKIKARQYTMINDILYKKSFLEPWLRDNPFKDWCEKLNIKQSNGDTPFSLTYGTEAVIPVEIGMPSLRCAEVNQVENNEGLLLNLDILEERREKAAVREAKSKAKMEKYYNARVRNITFRAKDFVYCSNEARHAKDSEKLGPKWEGPYEVMEALGKGAYKLRNENGDILPHTWNIKDLKNCYL